MVNLKGTFVILRNNSLETYNNFEEIPEVFSNVIRFEPDYPSGPHTIEQHKEIEKYSDYLKDLLGREDASSN